MPPPRNFSAKLDAQSSIASYVNNLSNSQYNEERERYEEQEPIAKSKSWDEFLRLAISRQYLERRSGNAKVEVRDGSKLLLRIGNRENNFMGFGKREDPRLDVAIANLDRRARKYAKEQSNGAESSRRGYDEVEVEEPKGKERSKAHKSEGRRSHHAREEEEAPRGRSKRGETIVVDSHHLRRRHEVEEQDAEPRRQLSITAPPPRRPHMSPNYEEENDHTPLHGRRNHPAPPQEYVYPAGPPIVITMPNQSSEPRLQDYHPPPQRPVRTRSHLSSINAPSMSGGLQPPAPSHNEPAYPSRRGDRLPERRESVGELASRTERGYSNRPSDRHSGGRDPLREDYSHTENWLDSLADGESRAGRQGRRRSGVSRESTSSSSSTHSDERRGSEATVALPNWGSGGGEREVPNRREGRVPDRHTS